MIAVRSMDVRDNFKKFCDKVFQGETIIVSRPKNENVIMLSEKEYNNILKMARNAEYLAMLHESERQFKEENTISFTLEELKEMESDSWKPTQKILDFERKNNIKRPGAANNE